MSRQLLHAALVLSLVALASCSDDSGSTGGTGASADAADAAADAPGDAAEDATDVLPDADAAEDSGADDVADAASDGDADAPFEPLDYLREYPLASSFPAPDGKVWRRAIIHLHSTHSHDACDGDPRPEGGGYNLPCLADLRAALCRDHIDFAYLTDHRVLMAETPFEDLLLCDQAAGDQLLHEGEIAIANEITCDDDFVVTTTVGMETSLMPVFFHGHVDSDPEVRAQILGGSDLAAVEAFRAGGAAVFTAHTEGKTAEEVVALDLDGLEIYNLHANIDPRIRQEDLHLESGDIFGALVPFVLQRVTTSPDLALLGFLEENRPSLDTWATALEHRMVVGTAGTDAHQNVLPPPMADGERFDSYRRMIAWFSNYVLADDTSLEAFDAALRSARLYVGFDTLAEPSGFDFRARAGDGPRVEMGGTATLEPGLALQVTVPAPEPVAGFEGTVRALLLVAADGHWDTVTEFGAGEHELAVDQAGIYRVEVHLTPRHLIAYLDPTLRDLAERELPWIYSNPIRVNEAE